MKSWRMSNKRQRCAHTCLSSYRAVCLDYFWQLLSVSNTRLTLQNEVRTQRNCVISATRPDVCHLLHKTYERVNNEVWGELQTFNPSVPMQHLRLENDLQKRNATLLLKNHITIEKTLKIELQKHQTTSTADGWRAPWVTNKTTARETPAPSYTHSSSATAFMHLLGIEPLTLTLLVLCSTLCESTDSPWQFYSI